MINNRSNINTQSLHGVRRLWILLTILYYNNMDLAGITPLSFNWDDTNLPEQWQKFKRHVELVFSGPLKSKTEEEKVSYLLLWMGDKGRDVRATWTNISEQDSKKLETYYKRFKDHVQPKLNPIFARYKFSNEVQNQDSIDAFVTRLRLSARDCNFTDANEMIRDRIVFGTNSSKIREKLINAGAELTLEKAIQIVQSFEYAQQQLRSMGSASGEEVHDTTTKQRQLSTEREDYARQTITRGCRRYTSASEQYQQKETEYKHNMRKLRQRPHNWCRNMPCKRQNVPRLWKIEPF